jgi:hypothetical protein
LRRLVLLLDPPNWLDLDISKCKILGSFATGQVDIGDLLALLIGRTMIQQGVRLNDSLVDIQTTIVEIIQTSHWMN